MSSWPRLNTASALPAAIGGGGARSSLSPHDRPWAAPSSGRRSPCNRVRAPGVPGQGGVGRQPVQLLDAVLGEEAVLLGTRLDYDRSDRRIAPPHDQQLELVNHRLVEIVVWRIRKG